MQPDPTCPIPVLKPAIIEKFIATAGSADPHAITVRAGGRVVLVPPPKSPDEASSSCAAMSSQAVVRVGIKQYPAGVGVTDTSQLTADLVDPCKNIRMGTALFWRVYRIVVEMVCVENDNAFEDPSSRGGPARSKVPRFSPRPIRGRPSLRRRAPTLAPRSP